MRLATILALISCLPAFGELVMYPDGRIRDGWPISISGDGWATSKPSADLLAASGYRLATADEIEAWETAEAAAAEAAAALVGPQPETLVPMLDADGKPVGTARILVDTNLQIIAVVNSASPQKPWAEQRAAYEAKAAAREARMQAAREAKSNGNLQRRIAALEALAGIE